MKRRRHLCMFIVMIGLLALSAAQAQPPPSAPDAKAQRQAQRQLEALRDTDPATYLTLKAQVKRRKAIQRILSAFVERKLDAASAEKRLYPLMSAQTKQELAHLDEHIAMAKKLVEDLAALRDNPDRLTQKRIDQLLGRAKPGQELWESFIYMPVPAGADTGKH